MTKRIYGKVLGLAAGVIAGLGVLALMPMSTQAEDKSAEPRETQGRTCVDGPGLDTHVLDPDTLLARDNGRAVLIKVKGCRLTPHDVLVFEYRGSSRICNPIDVDLSVRQAPGMRTPCFVQDIIPISNEEAKTLSKQKYQRNAEKDRG